MAKHKASDHLDRPTKKHNKSNDYVFYEAAKDSGRRVKTIPPTKIGK